MQRKNRRATTLPKRILSMLLAICMLTALAPVGAVEGQPVESAEPELRKLVYNFQVISPYRRGLDTNRHAGCDMSEVTDYAALNGMVQQLDRSKNLFYMSDPWCYAGQKENTNFKFANADYGILLQTASGTWNAPWGSVKIQVPAAGTYQMRSSIRYHVQQGIVRIYLAPAADVEDGADRLDEQYLIREIDTLREQDGVQSELTELGVKDLDAGEYILTYEINRESNEVADPLFGFAYFTLDPVFASSGSSRAYTYDLTKASGNRDAAYLRTITYSNTTKGATGELRTNIVSDPWMFHHWNNAASGYMKYNDDNSGIGMYPRDGAGAIKFKVFAD